MTYYLLMSQLYCFDGNERICFSNFFSSKTNAFLYLYIALNVVTMFVSLCCVHIGA